MRNNNDPSLSELLSRTRSAAEGSSRIARIVEDLWRFARPNQEPTRVDLATAVESAVRMARIKIEGRARLITELDDTAPILAEEGPLAQVFLNLLVNAAQAVERGDEKSNEIRARSWVEGNQVCLEICDTGCGIAPDIIAHIFEPYFTTKSEGYGLGLFVCHNIISSYGGSIDVESRESGGTRFCVRLPLAGESDSEPLQPAATPDEPHPATTPKKILVVDDEPLITEVIGHVLRPEYAVTLAHSVPEARTILTNDPSFDLLLCDLIMPGGSGSDLVAWIDETMPDLKQRIVFMTGGAYTAQTRKLLESTPNPTLHKPFDTATIKATVSDALHSLA